MDGARSTTGQALAPMPSDQVAEAPVTAPRAPTGAPGAHQTGAGDNRTAPLVPSAIGDAGADSAQKSAGAVDGNPRACGGRKKNGEPCGLIMTVETPEGFRCRYHRPLPPGRVRAPVARLGSYDDAAKMMSWCAVAIAEGRISQTQASALKAAVSEWRMAFDGSRLAARRERFVALAEAILRDERVVRAMNESTDEYVRAALRALGTR